MKLKNDIQVKAFLIRNKIQFQKYETYLEIDDEKAGVENWRLLRPYEYNGFVPKPKQGPQRKGFTFRSKYNRKEFADLSQLPDVNQEPEPEEKKRPPADYSNPKFNS